MAFGFFDGQKADASPESIKRKRAMIAQLLSGGRAPRNIGEGFSSIGDSVAAAILGSRADAEEKASNASSAEAIRNIYSGFGGGAPMAAVGGAPVAPRITPSSSSSQRDEPTDAPATALAQTTSSPDESVYGPVMPPEFFQVAGDLSERAPFAQGKMESPQGLVIHHTGGRGTPEGIMDVFRQRGLATQYVMDRDGRVFRSLPEGTRGRHLRPSEINNLSNSNALGIEIIARDDADVTPQQRAAAQNFTNYASSKYGFDPKNVFGHGELNSHKQSTEGMSAVADWRTYKGTGAPERSTAVAAAQPRTMQDRTLMAYAGGAREPSGPSPFDAEIRAASQQTGIPENIIRAKIKQESGFDPAARGRSGEVGLAQILPSTAARPGYGVQPLPADKLADPAANINFGAQYLAARGRAAGVTDWNDPNQAAQGLTAYNGGGDPNYAANVLRYLPKGGATPVPLSRQGVVDQGADGVSDTQSGALDAGSSEAEQANTGNIYSPLPMGLGDNPFLPRQPVVAPPAQPDPMAAAPVAPMPVGVNPARDTVPLPATNIQPPQSPFVPPAMRQPIAPMEAGENGAGAMQFIESEFARREGRPDPRMAIGAPQGYNPFVPQALQAPQMAGDGGSVQGASQGGAMAGGSAQASAQANNRIAYLASVAGNSMNSPEVRQLAMAEIQTERARAQAEAERARTEAQNRQTARDLGIPESLGGVAPVVTARAQQMYAKPEAATTDQRELEQVNKERRNANLPPFRMDEYKIQKAKAGAASVSVDASQKAESAFSVETGKALAKRFDEMVGEGDAAAQNLEVVADLRRLGTGIGTGAYAVVQSYLGKLGIKTEGLSQIEAYNALIDRLTPQQRLPGSGATSDFDAKMFKGSLTSLMNTPEGNNLIVDSMERIIQNRIARGDIALRVQTGELSQREGLAEIRKLQAQARDISTAARDFGKTKTTTTDRPGAPSPKLVDPLGIR